MIFIKKKNKNVWEEFKGYWHNRTIDNAIVNDIINVYINNKKIKVKIYRMRPTGILLKEI